MWFNLLYSQHRGALAMMVHCSHAIRFVGNDSVMTRVAGTGLPGYSGDNGCVSACDDVAALYRLFVLTLSGVDLRSLPSSTPRLES